MIESNNIVSTTHNVLGKYFRNGTLKEEVTIESASEKLKHEDKPSTKPRTKPSGPLAHNSQHTAGTESPTRDLDGQLRLHLINILSRTINHLFECGDNSLVASNNPLKYLPRLDDFIGRLYRRGNLTLVNLLTALLYLIRLKELRPTCKGSYGSGHRLFLASLILANKYLQDGAYHNKTWYKVIEGVYSLHEINQMERELLGLLNYELCVTKADWLEFTEIMDGKVTRSWARRGIELDPGFLTEKVTYRIDDPMGNLLETKE
ncbi:hypothetical protein K7432_012767 [Basidiobolus ranarum]|uniref:Cyclin N-terminal domain-containing protein n=1 Tax=Basidiobolus ranarum TaxID=34480 RepID=A0ABR2VRR8_9FUNG